MKIKSHGVNDIVFIPESRAEAELMERWELGRKCEVSLTTSDMWTHFQLTLTFDEEKGRNRKEQIHRDCNIAKITLRP